MNLYKNLNILLVILTIIIIIITIITMEHPNYISIDMFLWNLADVLLFIILCILFSISNTFNKKTLYGFLILYLIIFKYKKNMNIEKLNKEGLCSQEHRNNQFYGCIFDGLVIGIGLTNILI